MHSIMLPSDFFLENYITDHIVRIFYYMNITLSILFAAKYIIKDNFITPTGNIYNIIVYFVFGSGIIFKSYTEFFEGPSNRTNALLEAVFVYRFIYYCFSLIMLCYVNVTKSHTNILLVLKIQKINNIICKNKTIDNTAFWNFLFYLVNFIRSLMMIVTYFLTLFDNVLNIESTPLLLSFDANWFYFIRVLNLLRKYLKERFQSTVNEMNDELGCEEDCKV